jgi:hypothetical protein
MFMTRINAYIKILRDIWSRAHGRAPNTSLLIIRVRQRADSAVARLSPPPLVASKPTATSSRITTTPFRDNLYDMNRSTLLYNSLPRGELIHGLKLTPFFVCVP